MRALRQLVEADVIARQSGPGTLSALSRIVLFTSTGAGNALVLRAGHYHGQTVRITHVVDGGSGIISSSTTALGNSVSAITLTDKGDWVELMWDTGLATDAWVVIGCEDAGILS